MPGLPAVALDEAEAPGIGRQPTVGRFRAEIELGGAAVQRLARRGDPAGIWMGGKERRLLGVRAKSRVDDEREAGVCRRTGHAVEGDCHIRPHALAAAVDQRAAVAAATCHRGCRSGGGLGRRAGFGDRRCLGPRVIVVDLDLGEHERPDPDRGEGVPIGKRDQEVRPGNSVGRRRRDPGSARPGQVGALLEVTWIRRSVGQRCRR